MHYFCKNDRNMFSTAQIEILDMMSHVHEQNDFVAIRNMISDYFAKKADKAIEKMWDNGKIDLNTIDSWKNEHMRTPYIS